MTAFVSCGEHGCRKKFPNRNALETHKRTHTGERPYSCDWPSCKFRAAQKGNIKAHKRIHTGEKPFGPCRKCGERFTQASHWNAHQRMHSGDKPYKCHFKGCNYCSATLRPLQQHLTNHHVCLPDPHEANKKIRRRKNGMKAARPADNSDSSEQPIRKDVFQDVITKTENFATASSFGLFPPDESFEYSSPPESAAEDSGQLEEDEWSKINWSGGRKRLDNGLFSCLYDNRREKPRFPPLKAAGLKKKLRFVDDSNLVRTRFFEYEEEETSDCPFESEIDLMEILLYERLKRHKLMDEIND